LHTPSSSRNATDAGNDMRRDAVAIAMNSIVEMVCRVVSTIEKATQFGCSSNGTVGNVDRIAHIADIIAGVCDTPLRNDIQGRSMSTMSAKGIYAAPCYNMRPEAPPFWELIMAQFQIAQPQPAQVAALHEIYVAATALAPHCRYTPDLDRFGTCLLGPHAAPTQIVVAEQYGAPQGFAALGRVKNGTDNIEYDAITALFFRHAAAGQALLEACEARAQPGDLLAFPATHNQCPVAGYNGGWDEVSDRMPAIAQLLARNGYTPYHRELHLACDLGRVVPAQAAAPPGVELEAQADEQAQYFILNAMSGGQRVGQCHYITLASILGPGDAHTGYISWLHIEAEARRRGIGRYLMLQVLDDLRRRGCDACWLTTGVANWPAQPLYLALGFEMVDCSAGYRKTRS
jgi:ribosomal protein S18 acetylase RimI-like enzyme